MIFNYNPDKYKEYFKKWMSFNLLHIIFIISILSLYLYIMTKDYKITLIMLILFIAASIIGIPMGYIKGKGYFISFEIECNESIILIRNLMMFSKIIKIDKIKKIIKDDKNNIYIVLNKINIIRILPYIENNIELEKYLSNIIAIELNNNYFKYYICQYIPEYLRILPFFALLWFNDFFNNSQQYLFFALFILVSIYSSIKYCLDQIKIRNKIIAIIINAFIIFLLYMMYNEISS
jgi:hypothetical protein